MTLGNGEINIQRKERENHRNRRMFRIQQLNRNERWTIGTKVGRKKQGMSACLPFPSLSSTIEILKGIREGARWARIMGNYELLWERYGTRHTQYPVFRNTNSIQAFPPLVRAKYPLQRSEMGFGCVVCCLPRLKTRNFSPHPPGACSTSSFSSQQLQRHMLGRSGRMGGMIVCCWSVGRLSRRMLLNFQEQWTDKSEHKLSVLSKVKVY